MPDNVVFEKARANGDALRATFSEFKLKRYAGVRVFYRTDSGELMPGRNGCNLPVEEVPDMALAVLVLLRETSTPEVASRANELIALLGRVA